jgi:hypothetical protein
MSNPAISVLTRQKDFQPSIRDIRPPISAGITYGIPPEVGMQPIAEAPAIQFAAASLTTSVTFTVTTGMQILPEPFNISFAESPLTTYVRFTDNLTIDNRQIFDAITSLYLKSNTARDRQIANRLTVLQRVAREEEQYISPNSLTQFVEFFLKEPHLALPKITLTPEGALRARWIRGPSDFISIEFSGDPIVKVIAEIPTEDNLTEAYFSSVALRRVRSFAHDIGASFNP